MFREAAENTLKQQQQHAREEEDESGRQREVDLTVRLWHNFVGDRVKVEATWWTDPVMKTDLRHR